MAEPTHPAQPAPEGAGDPSMEDILASIRRILSEEEAAPTAEPAVIDEEATHAPQLPTAPHVPGGNDVFLLDSSMMVPERPPERPPEGAHEPAPEHPPAYAVAPEAMPEIAPEVAPEAGPKFVSEPLAPALVPVRQSAPATGLIAAETEAAAASSVGSLLRTLSAERAAQVHRGGPTIEDLVREELRPLLANWLDAHLPPMVERLVRAEIERVTGRVAP